MRSSSASKGPLSKAPISVQLVGGPTALIEIGGLRLLTDPTFGPPGEHSVGRRALVKTIGPAPRQHTDEAGDVYFSPAEEGSAL